MAKRRKVVNDGGSYHYFVPLGADDDLLDVHFRKGHLQKVGSQTFTVRATRITQKSDETWKVAASWGPLGDPEFALDLVMGTGDPRGNLPSPAPVPAKIPSRTHGYR